MNISAYSWSGRTLNDTAIVNLNKLILLFLKEHFVPKSHILSLFYLKESFTFGYLCLEFYRALFESFNTDKNKGIKGCPMHRRESPVFFLYDGS